jgi:phosphoglycolate phosphatase-like HAD superfamily hydrolase
VLAECHRRGLPTAVVTRNSANSTRIVLELHNLAFDHVFHRENGPPKPDPESIWQACRALNVEPADTWMVGDGRHDIEAAIAAGTTGIWLAHDARRDFAAVPDAVVASLVELQSLLVATFDSPAAATRV